MGVGFGPGLSKQGRPSVQRWCGGGGCGAAAAGGENEGIATAAVSNTLVTWAVRCREVPICATAAFSCRRRTALMGARADGYARALHRDPPVPNSTGAVDGATALATVAAGAPTPHRPAAGLLGLNSRHHRSARDHVALRGRWLFVRRSRRGSALPGPPPTPAPMP